MVSWDCGYTWVYEKFIDANASSVTHNQFFPYRFYKMKCVKVVTVRTSHNGDEKIFDLVQIYSNFKERCSALFHSTRCVRQRYGMHCRCLSMFSKSDNLSHFKARVNWHLLDKIVRHNVACVANRLAILT